MLPPYLDKGLELGPIAVANLAKAVSPDLYDVAVDPDRFSFRFSIAHIADWEEINIQRLTAGINESGAIVNGLDEEQRAIEKGYQTWDPVEQARLFVERRKKIVSLAKSLTEEQLGHIIVHSERGPTTVLGLLVTILGHDTYHIEHLTRYLHPTQWAHPAP